MYYNDVEIKEIQTGEEYEDAFLLLSDEFPDHNDTDLTFYEWILIAKKSNEVIGVITANRYIPKKAMICDIVVQPEHRSRGVALELMGALGKTLVLQGYKYLMGFTPKNNEAALSTYKKCHVLQEEQVVTLCDIEVSVSHWEQLLDRLEARRKRREKR